MTRPTHNVAVRKARRPDPAILRQFDTVTKKLEAAKEEYERLALPTDFVEFNLRQAKHILRNVEKELHFVN